MGVFKSILIIYHHCRLLQDRVYRNMWRTSQNKTFCLFRDLPKLLPPFSWYLIYQSVPSSFHCYLPIHCNSQSAFHALVFSQHKLHLNNGSDLNLKMIQPLPFIINLFYITSHTQSHVNRSIQSTGHHRASTVKNIKQKDSTCNLWMRTQRCKTCHIKITNKMWNEIQKIWRNYIKKLFKKFRIFKTGAIRTQNLTVLFVVTFIWQIL